MWFKRLPIPLEAIQWKGNNFAEIRDFMERYGARPPFVNGSDDLIISTLEGDMRAPVGSWILRGIMDEFYPCRQEVFEQIYKEMEEQVK